MFCLHPRNHVCSQLTESGKSIMGNVTLQKHGRRADSEIEMRWEMTKALERTCDGRAMRGGFLDQVAGLFSRGVSQAWLNRGHVVHCAALWLVNQCRVLSRPCAKQNIISQGGMYQYTYTGLLVKVTWTLPRRVIGTVLLYANLGVYGGTTAETFGTNWGTWISKIKTLMAMIVVQNGHPLCRK